MMEEVDRLVDENREHLEQMFAQKHNQLIAMTGVFKQTLETCKARGWDTHAQLWNTGILRQAIYAIAHEDIAHRAGRELDVAVTQ